MAGSRKRATGRSGERKGKKAKSAVELKPHWELPDMVRQEGGHI